MSIVAGEKIGRIIVLEPSVKRNRHTYWKCQCDCGKIIDLQSGYLITSKKRAADISCGCRRVERMKTHGGHYTPEYSVWEAMLRRCRNPHARDWPRYGGRGITVCDRWLGLNGFATFLSDMGPRPSKRYTIERTDNSGNYEPGNCIWATRFTQANNKGNNRFLEWNGQTKTIAEWARITNIYYETIRRRLYRGWSIDKTLSTKVIHK